MTRMILVRHGQSIANLQQISSGQGDYPLTELGLRQAELLADELTRAESIDRIYASDLCRAVDTARPTAERLGLPIHTDRRLREIDTGDWEGVPFDARAERNPDAYRTLTEDFSHMRYPNGESVVELYRRVVAALSEIAEQNDGKTVMVAAHAVALRAFAAYVGGYAEDEVGLSPAGGENASIQIFEYEPSTKRFQLLQACSTDHLNQPSVTTDEHKKA